MCFFSIYLSFPSILFALEFRLTSHFSLSLSIFPNFHPLPLVFQFHFHVQLSIFIEFEGKFPLKIFEGHPFTTHSFGKCFIKCANLQNLSIFLDFFFRITVFFPLVSFQKDFPNNLKISAAGLDLLKLILSKITIR